MNESEKPFFIDVFEEKIRKCEAIEDPDKRRDCKISILVDAVKKIGANQRPVSWWLEVIAEGTKPLFDEIKGEMIEFKKDVKKDLKKLDDGIGAISSHLGIGEEKEEND